jgi:hypothetical protein
MKPLFLILGIISGITGLIIFANSDKLSNSEMIEQNKLSRKQAMASFESEVRYGQKLPEYDWGADSRMRAAKKVKTAIICGAVSALLLVTSLAIPKPAPKGGPVLPS